MKRPLLLPLAIALALGATNVLALGLGPIHVKSRLNQPLDAEIPVIEGSAHDADGLLVTLAGADEFEHIGLSRSRLGVPLEFAVGKNAQGALVIKVTSKEPVRSAYLDFLVEANWTKGRLLREYTVLLDPPVTAPATGRATTAALAESPATVTVAKNTRPAEHAAATPTPTPAPRPAAKPAREAAAASKVSKGEYGPVGAGETLSEVARATREGTGASVNQMMMALLKSNPNAFYKDNINALKRGAILRVPAADEIKAAGSAAEAAAQVHAQIEDWRGGRAAPTLVADATGKNSTPAVPAKSPKTATVASKDASERLELVPPKAGKDSMAMADKPGHGAGSAAATGELKSELARTKETLTARDQEAGELKSKVKELEGLNGKNDRLINLKDSEIADLQQKLKQLQEKTAAAVAKPAVVATPKPAPAPAKAVEPVPIAATSIAPSVSTGGTPHDAVKAQTPAGKKDIWGAANETTTVTAPAPDGKTSETKTPVPAMPAPAVTNSSVSTSLPLAETPPTTAAAHPANANMTPHATEVATTAPKSATPVAAKPVVVKSAPVAAGPWFEQAWVKPAALGAGILLLLGGLLGLRKRKTAEPAGRNSIAQAFGESPLRDEGGNADAIAAEEAGLRDQLDEDPGNVGLHLELLSLYYAERDVPKFEEQAEQMREHVTDLHQPEWQEAEAMGQELAPDNPLFAGAAHHYDDAIAATHSNPFDEHGAFETSDAEHAVSHLDADPVFAPTHDERTFAQAPADDHEFTFDDLPPLASEEPVAAHAFDAASEIKEDAAMPATTPFDDFGDDAIGTKLDLAKAYMDMGDPEGARSMLEEVFAEGSEAQKAEAHRLMAEIR
ncbi:MAG: FimV/HubP family polar landmark protein [Dokdonella sp.]